MKAFFVFILFVIAVITLGWVYIEVNMAVLEFFHLDDLKIHWWVGHFAYLALKVLIYFAKDD